MFKSPDARMKYKEHMYDKIVAVANALYDAGYWSCDRQVDEIELWEKLRDALGRKHGTSPKQRYPNRCNCVRCGGFDIDKYYKEDGDE